VLPDDSKLHFAAIEYHETQEPSLPSLGRGNAGLLLLLLKVNK
jgi:hypothetical protein